jgi:hypothetical protein
MADYGLVLFSVGTKEGFPKVQTTSRKFAMAQLKVEKELVFTLSIY